MDLKEFTFRLMLLFLPGVVSFLIFDRLTSHKKVEPFFFVTNCFVFGLLAYLCTWMFSSMVFARINVFVQHLNHKLDWSLLHTYGKLALPTKMVFWDELQNSSARIEFSEIAWVTVVAIGLAVMLSVFSNFKVPYRIARWCRVSKKSGEVDVWAYVMNSRAPDTTFVTLRDIEQDLAYDGWIHLFSEDCSTTELLMRDVVVIRNSTGDVLYQVGAMYFKIDPKKIILEFRGVQITPLYKYEQPTTTEPPTSSQRGNTETGRDQPHANKPATTTASPATSCATTAAASEPATP